MTEPVVIEHAHSELGPSVSDRWLNCPGSVLYTRGMPDPASVYAAEGTAAHTVSEWCREQRCSAVKFKGMVLAVDGYEFKVNKEMIASVDRFCDYVEALPGLPFYEKRVYYTPWVPNGFGTMDDGRLADYISRVTDFKHGKGMHVDVVDNTQLMLYSLGLYYGYNHLFEFHDFILTIVQPRRDYVASWTISLPDLLKWADTVVKPTAALALKPGAPKKAGDWCQFCPAKRVCKTRLDAQLNTPIGNSNRRAVDLSQEFEDLDGEFT